MIKAVARLKKTKSPEKLVLLRNGEHELKPHIPSMEVCGWFVTHVTKRTDKTNLVLTSVETEYTLRDEGVQKGCYLLSGHGYTCAVCKKNFILTT